MRRIPLSRRSHIIGIQPLPSGSVEHESALERDFVTLTSFVDPTVCITSQPVTIHFLEQGIRRRYTPDFLLSGAGRRIELIEIKYEADLHDHRERMRPGFAAADAWARERAGTFRVVTEFAIRGPQLVNAQRLLPLRAAPIDSARAAEVVAAMRSQRAPTVGSVLAAVPRDSISLATLWRLIARGTVTADFSAAISFDTPILLA